MIRFIFIMQLHSLESWNRTIGLFSIVILIPWKWKQVTALVSFFDVLRENMMSRRHSYNHRVSLWLYAYLKAKPLFGSSRVQSGCNSLKQRSCATIALFGSLHIPNIFLLSNLHSPSKKSFISANWKHPSTNFQAVLYYIKSPVVELLMYHYRRFR